MLGGGGGEAGVRLFNLRLKVKVSFNIIQIFHLFIRAVAELIRIPESLLYFH